MTKSEALALIQEKVCACTRCPDLVASRTNTVFGEGNPSAKVMFIGEGPGQHEDEQGRPFVGPAGKLLNKIIKACQWDREEVYIGNIVKCRPPGNRVPTEQEAKNCSGFLKLQIRTINPKVIVCLGATAVSYLLGKDEPIGRLRGTWQEYNGIPVMPTYHPSYLLRIEDPERQKDAKGLVWSDMKLVLELLNKSSDLEYNQAKEAPCET